MLPTYYERFELVKNLKLKKDCPFFMLILFLFQIVDLYPFKYKNFGFYNKKSQNNPAEVTSLGWALAIIQISHFLQFSFV